MNPALTFMAVAVLGAAVVVLAAAVVSALRAPARQGPQRRVRDPRLPGPGGVIRGPRLRDPVPEGSWPTYPRPKPACQAVGRDGLAEPGADRFDTLPAAPYPPITQPLAAVPEPEEAPAHVR